MLYFVERVPDLIHDKLAAQIFFSNDNKKVATLIDAHRVGGVGCKPLTPCERFFNPHKNAKNGNETPPWPKVF